MSEREKHSKHVGADTLVLSDISGWSIFSPGDTPIPNTGFGGGDVAQFFRASDRHAADAGSIPWCSKGFFSPSQLSVQTLLHVSVHPRVQSHALTSVPKLKIL